jgi:trans-aconitate methyltransferase
MGDYCFPIYRVLEASAKTDLINDAVYQWWPEVYRQLEEAFGLLKPQSCLPRDSV